MQRDLSYANLTIVFKVKFIGQRYGFLQKYAGSGEIWFTHNLEILNMKMKFENFYYSCYKI
jgi:hypothetical protein